MKTFQCAVSVTNKAKEKIRELGMDERTFFLLEKSFRVHIEKYPQDGESKPSVALLLDNKVNRHFAKKCNGNVVVLHCFVDQERFVVRNVTKRPAYTSLESNWRTPINIAFNFNSHRSDKLPFELLNIIDSMAIAQESSTYVKKRIRSWEGYLKIEERTADIPDMTSRYTKLVFNNNFSRVTIMGLQLNEKEWKSLKDLSVKLKALDQDIGKVLKANRSAGTVEVELHGYMEEHARKNRFDVHPKEVIFSNFATLSQVKRLRQGFKQLENGLAANPELERLLFEHKPPVKPVKRKANLQFHNRLNDFQKEAVIGAMSAEDLYVIQGPPGTGKTTVISEICLQNAKAGLRTLVASQSNLAVDNALGRLLANKDIRILRVGRTESIEEEGKKFIEENVGQYWKDHTLGEVSSQFEARKQRETEIEAEWTSNEREQLHFQKELERVERQLEVKKQAELQSHAIQTKMEHLTKEIQTTELEHNKTEHQAHELEQSLLFHKQELIQVESYLANSIESRELQGNLATTEQQIANLRNNVALLELEDNINELKQASVLALAECDKRNLAFKQTEALLTRVKEAKKLDTLKWLILEQNLNRTLRIQELIQELEDIRFHIAQYKKLEAYNNKLSSAISYLEQKNISISNLQKGSITHTSSEEIDHFLNTLKMELKANCSSQTLIRFLEGVYSRRNSIWQRVKKLSSYDEYIRKSQASLQQLREELNAQIQYLHEQNTKTHEKGIRVLEELTEKITILENKRSEMMSAVEKIPQAKQLLQQQEAKAKELKEKLAENEQAKKRTEQIHEKITKQSSQLQELKEKKTNYKDHFEQLKLQINEMIEELDSFRQILSTEPEQEHEEILKRLASISFTRESLKQEKEKLPLFQTVQEKWLSLLSSANEHDLNEIRKLYVKHANVIGTTCVASARKDFIESYPVFDVVIIDEVSKATPPELLLPMLKGKKIILVGDHHQLPPLLGNDTLEETLQEMADESDDFEGKVELKQLLKESLFERLFNNLPKSNKTMLAIQYRMHENIMETISPFYEHESDQLQCGLIDSDTERDHFLESPLIGRNNHLLWMDIPNEPSYFEERMQGGKSLYNPSELKKIGAFLNELNTAVNEAKQTGRMAIGEKKSIGVISFYGEQVKRIDRMLQQELHLPHLNIRTGTVDRFQGMEMDVIVLSMVRNHNNEQDDIGFAKDYRRLNVALSRAKELLVIIGSSKMFTERTKHKDTRKMYQHVLDTVRKQQGLRMQEKVTIDG